jgi:sugar phosphate isomerase/epimerase
MFQFSIASYSFHRALAAGKQDIFSYITDSKKLGAAQLDPWNGHLAAIGEEDAVIRAGRDPENAQFSSISDEYVTRVRAAADEAGLPFVCLAIDGAHIYEPEPEKRQQNRASAYRWLDVAEKLGATQVRIDAGGPGDMPDEIFEIIIDGYNDLIKRAGDKGITVLVENHWGPTHYPDNVVKLMNTIDGLGYLFDSNNWADGYQERGWELCIPYTDAVHIKTFEFDANGNDPTVDIPRVVRMLQDAGYDDVWGIESVPLDGDEYGAITKTAALIERSLKK